MDPQPSNQPSSSLLRNLRGELVRFPPFSQMLAPDVDAFIVASDQVYFAPGEVMLAPSGGIPAHLWCIRQGHVTGRIGDDTKATGFEYDVGDIFPVGAVMGERAVAATYHAQQDVFCLQVKLADVRMLAQRSAAFAAFLGQRALRYLEQSQRSTRASFASQALDEQSLESPLEQLQLKAPVMVAPDTPLLAALTTMHERRIGSVLVSDEHGAALGILTRHDILSRVTLARVDLHIPISQVMSRPVHTLSVAHTAHDAALLMSRHSVRHVPVTRDGRVVGLVSERDLFALQRLSLKNVSSGLRAAASVEAMVPLAQDIKRFARSLLAQGVAARQLTQLISHLNDVLTQRLVALVARDSAVDMQQACWLAFGSEGRSEQTIATDQDNGLVFVSDDPPRDRPRWLAFAQRVNNALDACGYPLCKGNVMASNPDCCLSQQEWAHRFANWMERGAPEDLLHASIYFDLRPLAGNVALAEPLRALVSERAASLPRFIKQMADNSLRRRPALTWLGGLETQDIAGRAMLSLKLGGTAIFVDVARLYGLAHGVTALSTRERFEALGPLMQVPAQESQAWIAAFEYLQMLRLQVQMQPAAADSEGEGEGDSANMVELGTLNDIDQRMLKESLRVARRLQQKIELDYQR